MIEVSPEGMKIIIDDPNRTAFINHMEDVFGQAVAFTEQCLDLLVEQYGATRAEIDPTQFYYSAISDIIENQLSQREKKTVTERVAWVHEHIFPAYLGLEPHGARVEVIRRNQADYAEVKAQSIARAEAKKGAE